MLNANILQPQFRISGEILPGAYGIGDDDEWYVSCETISGTIWWWNDHIIITQHGTDQTENFEGNGVCSGFHACDDWQPTSEPVVSYGYYKFTFHFPSPIGNKIVYLDLRDADWSEHYSGSPDLYIRWNDSTGYFEYKNSLTENEYPKYKWAEFGSSGTAATIWELFENSNPNKDAFQPTPPQNFHCTNPTAYGQHPHFEWSAPEEPEDATFKYKIYRKEGAYSFALVASGFTDQSWTDLEVNIEPKTTGIQFTYYAKAYTDQSPDSDPSETAIIYGLYVQKSRPENSVYDCSDGATNCLPTIFNLEAYPNPFNPNTTIRYALPTVSHVTLKIFNLRGELVKTLVDGTRAANRYQVVWNGENESGAKVAAGIYLYQLKTDNYSQIKRMIFIK
jgi:membrane-bound inhibitor of C-type lysozyme